MPAICWAIYLKHEIYIMIIFFTCIKEDVNLFWHIMFSNKPISDRSVVFIRVLRFPPPIKLTARYNWNIVESGVKHHQTNKPLSELGVITRNIFLFL